MKQVRHQRDIFRGHRLLRKRNCADKPGISNRMTLTGEIFGLEFHGTISIFKAGVAQFGRATDS